jgi:hypothetical protein
VGLALRAGLDFRNKRPPADASHPTPKAASEKRPHLKNWIGFVSLRSLRSNVFRFCCLRENARTKTTYSEMVAPMSAENRNPRIYSHSVAEDVECPLLLDVVPTLPQVHD